VSGSEGLSACERGGMAPGDPLGYRRAPTDWLAGTAGAGSDDGHDTRLHAKSILGGRVADLAEPGLQDR
jgi:hypothetical protein